MAWAFATVARSDESLFVALAKAAERRMGDFKSQGLANMVWAFATAVHRLHRRWDAQLFAALAGAAERHMEEFTPQELVNTAWAFATTADLR